MRDRITAAVRLVMVIGLVLCGSVAPGGEVVPGCVAAVEKANGHYVKCALKHEASFTIHGNEAKRDKKLEICRKRFVRRIDRAIGKYGDESCTELSVETMQIEADDYVRQAVEGANGKSPDDTYVKYLIFWPEENYPNARAALKIAQNFEAGHDIELGKLSISRVDTLRPKGNLLLQRLYDRWQKTLKEIVTTYGGTMVEDVEIAADEDSIDDPFMNIVDYPTWILKAFEEPYWGINAYGAWEHQTDCSQIRTMLIDSGVDVANSPDLTGPQRSPNSSGTTYGASGNIGNNIELEGNVGVDDDNNGYIDDWYGWNVEENNNNVLDVTGHGTAMMGYLAASGNNGIGISGVCQTASAFMAKWRYGSLGGFLEGLDYALRIDAKIINQSQSWYCTNIYKFDKNYELYRKCKTLRGEFLLSETLEKMLELRVQKVVEQGILFFTSYGNSGMEMSADYQGFPQDYPGVYGVVAMDGNGLASYSNYGKTAEFAAPGGGGKMVSEEVVVQAWATIPPPGGSPPTPGGTCWGDPNQTGFPNSMRSFDPQLGCYQGFPRERAQHQCWLQVQLHLSGRLIRI